MIKVNPNINTVIRTKSRYGSIDKIRLHAGERDLTFNDNLWKTFIDSITQGDIRFYPNVDKAYDVLSQMIGINKEFLTLAEGSDRILKNIFQCFALQGSNVLSTNPCFPMYEVYAKIQNSKFVAVEYTTEKFPYERFLELIDHSVSLVILSNPSSPVGDTLNIEQITEIADRCKIYNCVLVVDEAYIDFSDVSSAISLIEGYDIIVVRTLSKSHGAAGLRIGYSISNMAIKGYLTKVSSMNEINGLTLKWLEALLVCDDSDSYINAVKEHRTLIENLLSLKNIKYVKSQTNYINVLGNLELEDILVKKATMPWDNNCYTRITVPADKKHLMTLTEKIKQI